MRELVKDDKMLHTRSDEIDVFKDGKELKIILSALKEEVLERDIVALSAPQLGYLYRIICMNFEGDVKTFINPLPCKFDGFTIAREKCISLANPEQEYFRPRSTEIEFYYQTPLGKTQTCKLIGMAAIVFQEQLDHLEGLLLDDVGMEIPPEYDEAPEEEKQEFLDAYVKFLEAKKEDLTKEIEENEELKKMYRGMQTVKKLATGEIQIKKNGQDISNVTLNREKRRKLEKEYRKK